MIKNKIKMMIVLSLITTNLLSYEAGGGDDGATDSLDKGNISIGRDSHTNGFFSVAIGQDTLINSDNSVAIGSYSEAFEDNVFSVGAVDNERRIINVSTPINDTDVTNKIYVDENINEVYDYVDNEFNEVYESINEVYEYVDELSEYLDESIDEIYEYVDTKDIETLNNANTYTDSKDIETLNNANTYTDNQTNGILESANTYSDNGDIETLNNANTYTDNQTNGILESANDYTDIKANETLRSANNYTDNKVSYLEDILRKEIETGVASSLALSGSHLSFEDNNNHSVAFGFGNYGSEKVAAVNYGYKRRNVIFTIGTTLNHKKAYKASISFGF